jgi:Rrf2 family protein
MIKLSKKWSYALKSIIFIAKKSAVFWNRKSRSEWLVRVSEISESENISLWMLRRIIADFERSWIVETVKWRNWWIMLWKHAHQISLYDILDAVGEELWITDCTKWLSCENQNSCSTEKIFWNLQKGFNTLLNIYTLDKIIEQ